MAIKGNTHKPTMSLRLLKKRKSSKDMEMSSMVNWESARKRSKPWPTLLIIWKWETKITEISLSKELRVLTSRRNKSLRINAELLLKPFSKKEESFKNYRRTTMTMLVVWWRLEPSHRPFKSRTRPPIWREDVSTKILTLKWTSSKRLRAPSSLLTTTWSRYKVMLLMTQKRMLRSSLKWKIRRPTIF